MRTARVLTALAVVSTLTVLPAGAVSPGQNGRIAFSSNRADPSLDLQGNFEIYTANPNGSGLRRLTYARGIDGTPVWSPDNRRIAFRSNRDQYDPDPTKTTYELYTMAATGAVQRRLTNNRRQDVDPSWSPDGTRIAFASDRRGTFDIYVMNADGSGQRNLTGTAGVDTGAAWAPDGDRIAFASDRSGEFDIYVMATDGSGPKRLTTADGVDTDPAWSPNGRRIAFASLRNGNLEIYVMNADGSRQRRLTADPGTDFQPGWSPDGRKIVFSSDRDTGREGFFHLYTVNSSGGGIARLLDGAAAELEGDWQTLVTPNQAIDAVRTVLRSNGRSCGVRVAMLRTQPVDGGYRVIARLTRNGRRATAIFDVTGNRPRPVNGTAKLIQRGCG